MDRFIELGGGAENGRFVIVPTGAGNRNEDGTVIEYSEGDVIRPWTARGLKHVRMLHTASPEQADTEAFVAPLLDATAVWFSGGRQWNFVDSYANTRTYREFHAVLERGGVIAGSSAGATIQGDYLVRGDTSGPSVVMTNEPNHQKGFEFLRKVAVDQHINTRNRWDDLIPVIETHPNLLGIGLSEGTAIIVTGDTFQVMGLWKVAVHDNTRLYQPWEKRYYVLSSGDVYDMKTRSVVARGNGTNCIETARRPATPAAVPEEILQEYVGGYRVAPNQTGRISRDGVRIFAESPDGGRVEGFATAEDSFVVPDLNAHIRFERAPTGAVAALVLRQNCRDLRAPRVDP